MDASFYGVGQSYEELVAGLEVEGGALLRKGRIANIQLPEMLAVEGREEALDDMDLTVVFSGLSNPMELKGTARWQGEPIVLQGGLRSDANIDLAFSSEMFSGSLTGPYSLSDGFDGIFAFQTDDFNNLARWYGRPLLDICVVTSLSWLGALKQTQMAFPLRMQSLDWMTPA